MQNEITRKYKVKDVEMLTAAATIVENAIANKTLLLSKRSTWADPFFNDLKTQIEDITETYLGKDAAKEMREATQVVLSIQAQAQIDLAEFKIQIEQDFKKEPVQKKEILTPTLNTEIVAKGIAQATIDRIIGYANTLKQANITQEGKKGGRKVITEEVVVTFNEIYEQVISIAKIAHNFYKTDKTKQELFSFAKVAATINSKAASTTTAKKKP
uniref:hypothetical protein n=1 Tax=Flavobacterium sp. TaxID=239 RepID=UPI00404817AA